EQVVHRIGGHPDIVARRGVRLAGVHVAGVGGGGAQGDGGGDLVAQLQEQAVVGEVRQALADGGRVDGIQHLRLHQGGAEQQAELVGDVARQGYLNALDAVLPGVEGAEGFVGVPHAFHHVV